MATGIAIVLLESTAVAPQRLATYLVQRATGHRPSVVAFTGRLASVLEANDRGRPHALQPLTVRLGAQSEPVGVDARSVPVSSTSAALTDIADVLPGDVITFAPGPYRFVAPYLAVTRLGTARQRITVRAQRLDTVLLEMHAVEGFLVTAPFWQFENLTIIGVCSAHAECEHAFHVGGNAAHFIARNNTLIDFNAHIKINGSGKAMPDDGLIEGNAVLSLI